MKPSTPARASGAIASEWPRTAPPHVAQSTCLSLRCCALGLEGRGVDGLRRAVQRHVDQRRHASGGCGLRRRPKSLPFRAARLVDVRVRVDEARQEHQVAEVAELDAGRTVPPTADGGDPFPVHDLRRRREPLGRQIQLQPVRLKVAALVAAASQPPCQSPGFKSPIVQVATGLQAETALF